MVKISNKIKKIVNTKIIKHKIEVLSEITTAEKMSKILEFESMNEQKNTITNVESESKKPTEFNNLKLDVNSYEQVLISILGGVTNRLESILNL